MAREYAGPLGHSSISGTRCPALLDPSPNWCLAEPALEFGETAQSACENLGVRDAAVDRQKLGEALRHQRCERPWAGLAALP
jgi:hypothetical protein